MVTDRRILNSGLPLEERVTAVESAVSHIESDVTDIKNSITKGFADLHSRIDVQEVNSRPHISQWASWAAVLLIIISMFGSGYVRDLNRVENETQNQTIRFRDIESKIPIINANSTRINALDNNIHREIDFRSSEINKRISWLEAASDRYKDENQKNHLSITADIAANTAFIRGLRNNSNNEQ